MPAQQGLREHEAAIRRDMKKWAKYRTTLADDIINLGYPGQSIEQTAGLAKVPGGKPEPEIDTEMAIDQIVSELHDDLEKIIYCRYKIPLELKDIERLNIPVCIMDRRGKLYLWSSNLCDCRNAIGLGRHQFDGLLRHTVGKIEGKLYK